MTKIENLILLGSGESLVPVAPSLKKIENKKTVALQRVFPYCYKMFGIVPDYWTWFDANGALEGLQYLMQNSTNKDFSALKIIIPHFVCESYTYYREFAGTTPLGHAPELWEEKYKKLLYEIEKTIPVEKFVATTTKNIALNPLNNRDFQIDDLHGEDSYVRFMSDKVLFGTVEFDSESVIGSHFKWGLESKFSSVMLPLAYYLKAQNVYATGIDFIGGRFYDTSRSRHAWGQDVNEPNEVVKFALSIIKKWASWQDVHGMKIMSLADDDSSLLGLALPKALVEDII